MTCGWQRGGGDGWRRSQEAGCVVVEREAVNVGEMSRWAADVTGRRQGREQRSGRGRKARSVDGGVRRVGLAMGGGGDRRQCWAQCVGARLRGLERKGMKSIRKGIRARQES